jgi:YHS domain-containing protein
MTRQNTEPTFTDPVCGMQLSHNTAPETTTHAGRTYYFCAAVCREAFEADPERYSKHHRQHGSCHQ